MFDINTFNVQKFDNILSKGLTQGLGNPNEQMCIEAAICSTLGLPHSDDPQCVSESIRSFKIRLNDANWSTPIARAKGLRNLGLAQLGSLGVIKDEVFTKLLAKKTISILIPMLLREVFTDKVCLDAADKCEKEATYENISAAIHAVYLKKEPNMVDAYNAATNASYAYNAATNASYAYNAATNASYAYNAATNASYAYNAATNASYAFYTYAYAAAAATCANMASLDEDKYLILAANLALECLKELNSPGVSLLNN